MYKSGDCYSDLPFVRRCFIPSMFAERQAVKIIVIVLVKGILVMMVLSNWILRIVNLNW